MGTVRRYGPALVSPQVSPRPELGNGTQQSFEAFQNILGGVQDFIRPAVEQVQTARGEQEALDALEDSGPEWQLTQRQGRSRILTVGQSEGAIRGGPTRVRAALQRAGQQHGVDPGVLSVIVGLESNFDPNAQNPNSSAGGLFQFIDSTAGDYNLGNRFDVDSSADAGARLTRDNMSRLGTALGRQPTVGEIYLAHQQGAGGAIRLLTAPAPALASAIVGRDAVRLNGGNPDTMSARDFAALWVDKANNYAGSEGVSVTVPGSPEYELETINRSTFEPRLPFTVRDAAFNRSADRVISARASSALEQGMRAAMQKADGDLEVLRAEMEKVRTQVMGELPPELPGLATDLTTQFERALMVAERQSIELSQRRVVQEQEVAVSQAMDATRAEAERLALTGASSDEISAHLSAATSSLVQFGPREEFTIAGQVYPADPTRAGILSPQSIATSMSEISGDARRIMLEADFQRSGSPGAYVDEFRRQIFAGNSPFGAGESLDLLRTMEGQARAAESRRRTAAEAERRRLETEMGSTINAYVSMTEAGVPVAIPQEERSAILSALSPYPDLQRKALIEFQVADAAVATHGMNGPELLAYVERVRTDMQSAIDEGNLDLGGAAIIESLEDRVKQVQDAVTAETIGLPLVEQLALSGASVEAVDYDALRDQAAGNEDVVRAVNEVEAFHRDVESLQGMSAADREAVLEDAGQALAVLAASGEGYGAQALMTQRVVDRLDEWSAHRQELASSDPVQFAASVGVELPSFEGAETMGDMAGVLSQRVGMISPHTAPEGVENPVPLTQPEIDAISEIFQGAPRAQKAEFLATISDLGQDQAMAIFSRIGQSEPALFAAGAVYSGGNQQAAGIILRGAVDTRLGGGAATDVSIARNAVLGPLFMEDMISPEGVADLDTTAMAYARGVAMAAGGRDITVKDIQEGYLVALGRQTDGSGGVAKTRYGATILPAGWTAQRVNRAIGRIDDEQLVQIAKGLVVDNQNRNISARDLLNSIEGLQPSPDDPNILVPIGIDGGVFLTTSGGGHIMDSILMFDLRELE